MASFFLEDLEGSVETLVFPEAYKKAAGRLADDQVVLVKGRAEVQDDGRAKLLASEVLPLEQAKLAEARYVTIRVPRRGLGPGEGRAAPGYTRRAPGRLPGDARARAPRLVGSGARPERLLPGAAGRRAARRGRGAAGAGVARAGPHQRAAPRGLRAGSGGGAWPRRTSKRRSSRCRSGSTSWPSGRATARRSRRPGGCARSSTRGGARSTRSSRPWQKTLVARHPNRPYTLDYVQALFTEWTELHGDRRYGDDPALVCGFALYHDLPVCVDRAPEGARHEAEDLPQLRHAEARGLPQGDAGDGARREVRPARSSASWTRPGAYPGLDAEERGQAEAIAWNLREMARLRTPIVVTVTGEGGSGGALAIAVGDRVNMLEHAVYSVISPEGCASILFRDASRAEEAATAMKITARDLAGMGLVDEVVPEPPGGAHVNHEARLQVRRRGALAAARGAAQGAPGAAARGALPQVPRHGPAGAGVHARRRRDDPDGRPRRRGHDGAGDRDHLRRRRPRRAAPREDARARRAQSVEEIGHALDRDIAKWRRTESEKKAILGRVRTVDDLGGPRGGGHRHRVRARRTSSSRPRSSRSSTRSARRRTSWPRTPRRSRSRRSRRGRAARTA